MTGRSARAGLALALALGAGSGAAALATAQAAWQEDRTEHVRLLSLPGTARAALLERVEPVHLGLSELLAPGPPDELTVRAYPSGEALRADRPLVQLAAGLVAYPRRSRQEVAVVAPEAAGEEALAAALRYELAHRALVARTEGRLPEGFQEGLAAYLAGPAWVRAEDVATLRSAWGRDALPGWAALAAPGAAYAEPGVSYPAARALAQFLVDIHGMGAVDAWLAATAAGADWRDAIRAAFGRPPEELEPAWREWLPGYLDGGWRRHGLYAPDLAPVEDLLAGGDYGSAQAMLSAVAAGQALGAVVDGARHAELSRRADAGARAEASLAAAIAALEGGDYGQAATAGDAAAAGYVAAGDARRAAESAEAARRGRLGQAAARSLADAAALPSWRALEARGLAAGAGRDLAALGNAAAAGRAGTLREALDGRLRPAGLALVAMGTLLLGWNLRRRRAAGPAVWG
jgi:hypothetical protein